MLGETPDINMKNRLCDVKEKITTVLKAKDILFIVPPFTTNSPSIGPHILQAIAREKGYHADILYLNLLLASIIGFQLSEKLGTSELFQYWSMLNERLFARSAYGLASLGKHPEHCSNEAMSVSGNLNNHRKMDYDENDLDINQFWKVEEICKEFVEIVVQLIASMSYKIVGFTCRMGQTNSSIAVINGIKQNRPEIITIIGGSNCQNEMAEGIASLTKNLDYVFSGESEISFADFLDSFSKKQLPNDPIIKGEILQDLDNLPLLDYSSYFRQMKHFFEDQTTDIKFIWHETSRGCWWGQRKKCNFCSRNNESLKFRSKSPNKVLEELSFIKDQYPNIDVAMTDNIMPFSYYKELLPILSEKKDFPNICLYYTKANLKLKHLIHLKTAHVKQIIPGMESLSTDLLKLINKGVTARENLLLLRNAYSVGINLFWFMLWGVPGDKAAHYREILRVLPYIRHLQPPAKFFCVHIERFSVYFDNQEFFNINNLKPWEVYKNIYPQWADIHKLAFNFVADYPSEAYEHPELIQKIVTELAIWKKTWKDSKLMMFPVATHYMIYDKRTGANETNHILDYSQAKDIMKYSPYTESKNQQWAVEEKLGLIVDSHYVPLVTTTPELLLQFEE